MLSRLGRLGSWLDWILATPPQINTKFIHETFYNPWSKDATFVTIVDVKDGWVKFAYDDKAGWSHGVSRIREFRSLYKEVIDGRVDV